MGETDHVLGFRITVEELSQSGSGLSVMKYEIDSCDPDPQWRWLAEGIIELTTMFGDSDPKFAFAGRAWSYFSFQAACLTQTTALP